MCFSWRSSFWRNEWYRISRNYKYCRIAAFGKIDNYPDPLLYLAKSIYPGCYVSVSDIITAENITKSQKKLMVSGINEEINNCIPIFSYKRVYDF